MSSFRGQRCHLHNPGHIRSAQELANWIDGKTDLFGPAEKYGSISSDKILRSQGIIYISDFKGDDGKVYDHIDLWNADHMAAGEVSWIEQGRATWFWPLQTLCDLIEPAMLKINATPAFVDLTNTDPTRTAYYVAAAYNQGGSYIQPDQARLVDLAAGRSVRFKRGVGQYWDPSLFLGFSLKKGVQEERVMWIVTAVNGGIASGPVASSWFFNLSCLKGKFVTHPPLQR